MENESKELVVLNDITNEDIKRLIYTVREKQVMLDSDVARLYHYETKDLNRNVRNNIKRFPDYYCFQLKEEEYEFLRCKNFTLNKNGRGKHRKYLPYAFTEYGIIMLAGLLKSDIAVQVSIKITNAFIEMRKIYSSNQLILNEVLEVKDKLSENDKKFLEYDKKFDEIFNMLQHEENIKERIFFNGQIYDAYVLLTGLIEKANRKIVLIDNYADTSVLEMLTKKKKDVEVIILTSDKSNIMNIDVKKFNKQYPTLKVARTNKFHDRFIIIDDNKLYSCGPSIKDAGNKVSSINKMESKEIINIMNKTIQNNTFNYLS